MSQIIVGVDESDGAATALRWAVDEGAVRGWAVKAVLAWDFLDQHHLDESFDPGFDQAAADKVLAAAVTRAVGDEAAEAIDKQAVCGRAVTVLTGQATGHDLLVVGARGMGGFTRLLLGSVSDHCLQTAACPVAVIRRTDAAAGARGRVVVGVDGSETAQRALHWALAEARLRSATLEVVHAWRLPIVGGMYATVALDDAVSEDLARHTVEAALAKEDLAGVTVEHTLLCASPAEALLNAAGCADLVVVGSRGLGGLKRVLLGSVSRQVAHHTHCPIVVVPPPDR